MGLWLVGLITCVMSCFSVWGIRWWAINHQLLAIPNKRSSHIHPIPIGGGLAIVILTTIIWLGYGWYQNIGYSANWILPFIGACMVAMVGWIDDLYSLSSNIRLSIHVLSGILAILGLGYWNEISLLGMFSISLGYWGVLFTLLWVVGLINAYNFMDGIDGLAGSQAVIAGMSWYIIGLLGQVIWLEILGVLVAASSLGFLIHNWSPARIFMGDVASGFLGYLFAILPLIFYRVDTLHALPIGLLVVWPFLFDAGFTFLRRLSKGENVFQAHRSHLYQRLVIAGYSHRLVTWLYISLASSGAVLIVGWYMGFLALTVIITFLLVTGLLLYVLVKYCEHKKERIS